MGDGAEWIWNLVEQYFPGAVQIVDLYHALVERLLQGVHATSLSCDPANPAWRLYVRFGFEPLPDGRTMLRMKSSIG
jgi:hypothetical protein